jgi:adenylate cyclase
MLGETQQCKELAHTLLSIAEQEELPAYLLVAHMMMAVAYFLAGEFSSGSHHFARAVSFYTTALHSDLVIAMGFDFGLLTRAFWAHTLWCSGYADQALQKCREALGLAEHLAHPYSHVMSMAYLAMLLQFRREREATLVQAEIAVALATRHEANYYGAWVALLAQWARAAAHPVREEVDGLRHSIDEFRVTGAEIRLSYFLSLLAELYHQTGRIIEAVDALDEAFAIAAKHGEHWWDAELHRIRGLLLLAQGADAQQVEAAYQQALAIARQQRARSLELRAAMSLARLWQQSQPVEAYNLLKTIYDSFSEGFDTLDLQEAKALLAEMA